MLVDWGDHMKDLCIYFYVLWFFLFVSFRCQ